MDRTGRRPFYCIECIGKTENVSITEFFLWMGIEEKGFCTGQKFAPLCSPHQPIIKILNIFLFVAWFSYTSSVLAHGCFTSDVS